MDELNWALPEKHKKTGDKLGHWRMNTDRRWAYASTRTVSVDSRVCPVHKCLMRPTAFGIFGCADSTAPHLVSDVADCHKQSYENGVVICRYDNRLLDVVAVGQGQAHVIPGLEQKFEDLLYGHKADIPMVKGAQLDGILYSWAKPCNEKFYLEVLPLRNLPQEYKDDIETRGLAWAFGQLFVSDDERRFFRQREKTFAEKYKQYLKEFENA